MQGSVLYSNYGYKSDEELIIGYGFTLPDNPANFFHVMIGLADKAGSGTAAPSPLSHGSHHPSACVLWLSACVRLLP